MSTPPLPGKGLSVKVDAELYDDLAVIMSAGMTGDGDGMTASMAVKHAVSLVAGTYRNAWSAKVYPPGVEPQIIACQVAPYDPAVHGHTGPDQPGHTETPPPAEPGT
ncbi:hypothetical protein [Streptomyces odonnellii]|uniref:hypothetical protein n=1 Tax=Streptomyces odonnellii TaxID=1417980 RepID=UPI000696649E|nr:hypothetical protein [Streptomyces odonnellii]